MVTAKKESNNQMLVMMVGSDSTASDNSNHILEDKDKLAGGKYYKQSDATMQ